MFGNFEKILKILDENSIEKLNFLFLFFRKFVNKKDNSEVTPFFYKNFSVAGGAEFHPFPPGYALAPIQAKFFQTVPVVTVAIIPLKSTSNLLAYRLENRGKSPSPPEKDSKPFTECNESYNSKRQFSIFA